MLSKSSILKGVQCEKYLWLSLHHPEWQDPISESQQAKYNLGHKVGKLAQDIFPGGYNATDDTGKPNLEAVKITQQKINDGKSVIYEACFIHDQVLVAVDILVKTEKGWCIYEVKNTTEVKAEHYLDAAIQWWVLKNCELCLSDIFITHINNEYVRLGDLDLQQLFISVSVKSEVEKLLSKIPQYVANFNRIIVNSVEPNIEIGPYCDKPNICGFKGNCWHHIPENSVFEISGLNTTAKFNLYKQGIINLKDIPDNLLDNENQRLQVDAYNQNRTIINDEKIKKVLNDLIYPIFYLDFEGLCEIAIPLFNQSRAYQQIPFQYSLHIQKVKGGPLTHHEFLADLDGDPRIPFIESLLTVIGTSGSIVVYNKGYESSRIKEIARDFPKYENPIKMMQSRFWDLMTIFQKKWYYTAEMQGSYSIKAVLPALVPQLNYKKLNVQNGGMASLIFLKMIQGESLDKPHDKVRSDLLEYCKMDTWAMVKLLEYLQSNI